MSDLYFLEYFINPNQRIFWIFILSSLFIAIIYLILNPKERKINISKKLWFHPSATLDYRYFVISFFIKILLVMPIVIVLNGFIFYVQTLSINYFTTDTYLKFSYTQVMILFTISLFVVNDFSRYWLHRFLHTVPLLWEFHKVHHSAKVLTPITFYRVHPVENILFGFGLSLSVAIVSGIFILIFGDMLSLVDVLGVNIIALSFNIIGSNLRHSHIKLKYFTWLERIIISPFQHQIHHSTKFYDYNFGASLAIWDLWFGTLKHSSEIKYMRLGLGKKNQFKSVLGLLLLRREK